MARHISTSYTQHEVISTKTRVQYCLDETFWDAAPDDYYSEHLITNLYWFVFHFQRAKMILILLEMDTAVINDV